MVCATLGGGVLTATERHLVARRAPSTRGAQLPIAVQMSRNDLPKLTRAQGYTRGAEIGVWKGAFSASFCAANPKLHMLCVDPWLSYPAWLDTKNAMPYDQAQRLMQASYELACETLAPLNCTIVRKFSAEAVADVLDRSLDFVYIDGNHVFDAVTEDLELWSPKVKRGGFVAGHDFRIFPNKPTIHVKAAVEAYTKAHHIAPWYVLTSDRTPSFLWVVK